MDFKEEDSDGFQDDQVFGSKPRNVTYKKKERGQRYPNVPDGRPPKEGRYGYKQGHKFQGRQDRGKPREGPRYQRRNYKYEDLLPKLEIDPKMIIFEWRQIMRFIQNKTGPYKTEMHVMKAAQQTFTPEDVKQALSGAQVFNIEIGGKVGPNYSIFLEVAENKDIEFIGQMEAWKIKDKFEFEIFIHRRKAAEGTSFNRQRKPRKEDDWLPGFNKTKGPGDQEKKRPNFINTQKKESDGQLTDLKRQESTTSQSKEDPFGGLAPRDQAKFKRELQDSFNPSRAEPPKVFTRQDKPVQQTKEENKAQKTEQFRQKEQTDNTKSRAPQKQEKPREERATEKKDEPEQVKQPAAPKPPVFIGKLPIDEIRGYGARDKAISTVQGEANQSVISQRSYQTTMSKKGYHYQKKHEKKEYRKVNNRSYYGEENQNYYYQKDYRQQQYDEQPRGQGYQGEPYRKPRGRGRGYPPRGGRGYTRGGVGPGPGPGYNDSYVADRGAYRSTYEPRRASGYRGRGYSRGGRGYGGPSDYYYDQQQQQQQQQQYGMHQDYGRYPYEGQRSDQPILMKEESSMSATSAAGGLKVKKLKVEVEDKDKQKKRGKQDGGFKNRFSELV